MIFYAQGPPGPNIDLDVYHCESFLSDATFLFFGSDAKEMFQVCLPDIACQACDVAILAVNLFIAGMVFIATLVYSIGATRSSNHSHLLQALVRDGTLYFFFFFSTNLLWLLFIVFARVSLVLFVLSLLSDGRYRFSLN
jgi:hypothetical protein